MSSSRVRRGLAALAFASLLAPIAACADDDSPLASVSASRADASPTASATATTDTFPVTIEQSVGNVTIPAAPTRVVALDFPSADAAIALGVVPVGMLDVTYVEGGIQDWTKAAIGSRPVPELFNQDNGFPFETLARLDPDVFLATNAYPLVADSWSQLNAIAPVVAHIDSPGTDDWQDGVRKIAKALGKTAEGERLLAEAEDVVAETKDDHPEFLGKTASFFNYAPGDALYAISDNNDVSMRFLRDLGFAGAPRTITELNDPASFGRAPLSAEKYQELEADVILGTSTDPTAIAALEENDLFTRVPAVERGAFLGVAIGPATALAFPSILSVQWAIRELIDDLSDAVLAGEDPQDSTTPTADSDS